jgi:hypothetical protein
MDIEQAIQAGRKLLEDVRWRNATENVAKAPEGAG